MRTRNKGIVFLTALSLVFSLSACQDSDTNSSAPGKKPAVAKKSPAAEKTKTEAPAPAADTSATEDARENSQGQVTEGGPAPEKKEIIITDDTFRCIREMDKAGRIYVDNFLGNVEATLTVAHSGAGNLYPPGSIVQLLPGEAMVKLEKGASPATNDWEFFVLDVSEQGTKIKQRGFDKVGNMFGSCLSCHQQAAAQDMICGGGDVCMPINFPGLDDTEVLISALQKTDKRCPPEPDNPDVQLKPEEIEALKKLEELIKAAAEKKAGAAEATPAAAGSENQE